MRHAWRKACHHPARWLVRLGDSIFGRYLIVGGLSTLTHVAVLAMLIEWFGVAVVPATVVAFSASRVVSFALNYLFAFRADTVVVTSFLRFTSVALLGLLLNVAIMEFFVNRLGLHYGYAMLIAIGVVTLNNFSLHYFWTFEKHRQC